MKALDERFEPANQKTLYQAEFQTCRKKQSEGWDEFSGDLRTLADKGFPELQDKAREQLRSRSIVQPLIKFHFLHYDVYHILGTVHSVLLKLFEGLEKALISSLADSKILFCSVFVSAVYCN